MFERIIRFLASLQKKENHIDVERGIATRKLATNRSIADQSPTTISVKIETEDVLAPPISRQIGINAERRCLARGRNVTFSGPRHMGRIVWFDIKKKYGFVRCDKLGKQIFIHGSALRKQTQNESEWLDRGELIEFSVRNTNKGPAAADAIRVGSRPISNPGMTSSRNSRNAPLRMQVTPQLNKQPVKTADLLNMPDTVDKKEPVSTALQNLKEAFSCKICLEVVCPPVMLCKMCLQVIGCGKCVGPIRAARSAHCPLCRRAWSRDKNVIQVRGLDEALKILRDTKQ